MQTLLAIAAGGAFGAVSRYLTMIIAVHLVGAAFPWGTLTVNVLGSFLMGVLTELFRDNVNIADEVKFFLTVGFMGSYTTFSTFSLDVQALLARGEWVMASAYIFVSVLLSIAALMLGMYMAKLGWS